MRGSSEDGNGAKTGDLASKVTDGGDERAGVERRQELVEELRQRHGSSYV
jgi:hypothetical protein